MAGEDKKTKGFKLKEDEINTFVNLYKEAVQEGVAAPNDEAGFFNKIVVEYQKIKKMSKLDYGTRLENLNYHLNRISQVFVDLAIENNEKLEAVELEYSTEILKKENMYDLLRTEYEKSLHQLEDKANEFTELNKVHEELKEDFNEISNELSKKESEFEARLAEKEDQVQKRLDDKEEQIASLKGELTTKDELLISRNDTIVKQAEELERLRESLKELEELQNMIKPLQDKISEIQEQHERALKDKEYEFKEILLQKESELRDEIREKMEDKFEIRLENLTAKHNEIVEGKNREIVSLRSENRQLSANIEKMQSDIDRLKNE